MILLKQQVSLILLKTWYHNQGGKLVSYLSKYLVNMGNMGEVYVQAQ